MIKNAFALAMAACAIAFGSSQAAVVTITPAAQAVQVGSTLVVDVRISGLAASMAPSLGVFDFDFGFDAAHLAFQGAVFGAGLDVLGLGSLQVPTPGFGTVNLFELSLDSIDDLNSLQPDTFLLASLTFRALDVGNAMFSVMANAFGDAVGDPLVVTFNDPGMVTILEVPGSLPEPTSYALVLLALLGAAMTGRRRER